MTLLHSRQQLLPRFNEAMHEESKWFTVEFNIIVDMSVVVSTLAEMNVNTLLGERLDLASPAKTVVNKDGTTERVVRTQSGKEIQAGIVVCQMAVENTGMSLSSPGT